jgi:galactonate dehydratase
VRIKTDQGVEGIGEAFAVQDWSKSIQANINQLAPQLIGTNPLAIGAFLGRHFAAGSGHLWTSSISAVEIALWDILGQVAGLPIYTLLGGRVRDRVRLYISFGSSRPAPERAVAAKDAGFEMLKVDPFYLPFPPVGKPFEGMPNDEQMRRSFDFLQGYRDALGEDYPIGVDAHWKFSLEGAKQMARGLESFAPAFLEEPTTMPNDPEHLRQVAQVTETPLCTGEHFCNRVEAKRALDSNALTYINPEITWNGGILETVKTAALAESYNVGLTPHCYVGPISALATAHVSSVVPNFLAQEYSGAAWGQSWYAELLDPPLPVNHGHIELADRPGLGAKLNEKLLKERRIA